MPAHAVILKYLRQFIVRKADNKILPMEVKMESVAKVRSEFRNLSMMICSYELVWLSVTFIADNICGISILNTPHRTNENKTYGTRR